MCTTLSQCQYSDHSVISLTQEMFCQQAPRPPRDEATAFDGHKNHLGQVGRACLFIVKPVQTYID